ncbi:hypothetical protein TNCV_4631011 [Trichonephila clavipes]|nr:hypothetical protein TNCV_4631011 [Trichonephila clavipes]
MSIPQLYRMLPGTFSLIIEAQLEEGFIVDNNSTPVREIQGRMHPYSLKRRLSLRIIGPNLEYLGILPLTANLTLDSKWSSVKREYVILIIFFVENVDSHR